MTTRKKCAPVQTTTPASSSTIRRRVISPASTGPGAKQSFKKDCDINVILARYQVDGALQHFRNYAPEYGDFSGPDFHTAMCVVGRMKTIFEELPSRIRQRFESPAEFFDWVKDPDNADEAYELGLRETQRELPEETIPAGVVRPPIPSSEDAPAASEAAEGQKSEGT